MTATVIHGDMPDVLTDWLERRRALGQDGHDEVRDGEYHAVPMADSVHGDVDDQVGALIRPRARRAGLWPVSAVNIGVPSNYRVPDRAVLRDRKHAVFVPSAAVVVEIVAPNDESYAKVGFFFARGVDEVLIVDPLRRTVEWYTRGPDAFERTGRSVLLDLDEPTLHGEIDWPPA